MKNLILVAYHDLYHEGFMTIGLFSSEKLADDAIDVFLDSPHGSEYTKDFIMSLPFTVNEALTEPEILA